MKNKTFYKCFLAASRLGGGILGPGNSKLLKCLMSSLLYFFEVSFGVRIPVRNIMIVGKGL